MDRKVIKDIYDSGVIEELVAQMCPKESKDDKNDFIQEVYLALMEMPEDKLLNIVENKNPNFGDSSQIRWWCARIILNQLHSKTSQWYRLYRRCHILNTPITDNIKNIADE